MPFEGKGDLLLRLAMLFADGRDPAGTLRLLLRAAERLGGNTLLY